MKVVFLRQPYKFIRSVNKGLRSKIKAEVLEIQKNPYSSGKLKGKLKDIYSRRFGFKGVAYRIAYKIVDNVIVIAISTRENFYRNL